MRTTPSMFEMGFAAIFLQLLSTRVFKHEVLLQINEEMAQLGGDTNLLHLIHEAQENVQISADICFLAMAEFWGIEITDQAQA